ncbi:hypothetical protein NKR17_02825 [Priestia flexa]|uniref:hypothetical protein n=1 Tax=Priestia flexa TaxID=86664 RepID=UPI00209EDE12|nr:hypothetical protein [Priestia flexa]MCP1188031.1 hypothetical protein [Priestia flexa]
MESKVGYLQMIQNVISRMASNSFLLKGWTVTLVVGLFAFANISEMSSKFILLSFIPTLIFWSLDGFFIHQESLFIKLYEKATQEDDENITFSMKVDSFKAESRGWLGSMFSVTLLLFYPPLILVISAAVFLMPKINLAWI